MYHVSAHGVDERMINVHYYYCTIGKDGGFIRRDRSFHLPRIDLAGRCVTDTLSKKLIGVWMSTG